MGQFDLRQWLVLIGVMIINVFLVWFGLKLLFFDHIVSQVQLFLLGCAGAFCGVFVLSSGHPRRGLYGTILVLVGVYYFARAADVFRGALFSKALGLASLAAAVILTYIALSINKESIT